jgi:ribonuclease P protein component
VFLEISQQSKKLHLYGFQKSDRLLKRHEFLEILKVGHRIQNRQFKAVYQKNNKGTTRIGITITKRVGNAVTRNKLKRLIREYFRKNRQKLPANVDINIIAKKEAVMMDNQELLSSLNHIFDKITYHVSKSS